jgi:hypothetical protein
LSVVTRVSITHSIWLRMEAGVTVSGGGAFMSRIEEHRIEQHHVVEPVGWS